MGMLQDDKVIFYHPLNDATEHTQSQAWEGTADYGAGKVSNAVQPIVSDTPTLGAEKEFLSTTIATAVACTDLDSTHFVVCYRDLTDDYGRAKVGTVSGSDITFGAAHEWLSTNYPDWTSVAKIDSTHFVLCYEDKSDSDHGTARIGTVSGTDITFGAEAEFVTGAGVGTWGLEVAVLDSTHFVVCYSDGSDSNHGAAKIGHVTGTSISFGAKTDFQPSSVVNGVSCADLDSTHFVVCYTDGGASNAGTAKLGTVAGTSITFSAGKLYTTGTGVSSEKDVTCTGLDSTRFVVCYRDAADSNHGTAKVGTVSGTDITFGAENEFLTSAAGPGWMNVRAMGSTKFAFAYKDETAAMTYVVVGTVSGTDITFGSAVELASGNTMWNGIAPMTGTAFAICYRDNGDSSHGTAKAGTVDSSASLANPASDEAAYGAAADYDTTVSGQQRSAVARLDDTHAIVCWLKPPPAGSKYGAAKVVTISGSSVTFGPQYQFKADFASGDVAMDVAALSSTKALIVYSDQSDSAHGTAQVATVSGNDITYGSEVEFFSNNTFNQCRVAAIDSTRAIVAYRTNTNAGQCKIATVSGADVTFGSAGADFSNGASHIDIDVLDSTTALVAYAGTGDGFGYMKVCRFSGTTIDGYGSAATFLAANGAYYQTVSKLDLTRCLVTFQDASDSNKGKAFVAMISGWDVTAGSVATVDAGTVSYPFNAALSSTRGVVAYKDVDDGSKGSSRVLTVSGTGITVGPQTYFDTGSSDLPAVAAMTSLKLVVSWQNGSPGSLAVGDVPLGGAYPSASAATKVSFCGWFNKPS